MLNEILKIAAFVFLGLVMLLAVIPWIVGDRTAKRQRQREEAELDRRIAEHMARWTTPPESKAPK